MATGLFPIREGKGGPRRGYIPKNRRNRVFDRTKLDAFAEALAEHGTVTAASHACGISQQRGSVFLARIRRGLGWQAQ